MPVADLRTQPPKPALQERAERALERVRKRARRPIVVEFAGVPKAGKTSTISQVETFLRRCGFRVQVVVERASVCPIRDKKHSNFNIWTACTTLAHLLEKTQEPPRPDDPEILILDRGLFDSLCWLTMMEQLSRIRPDDRQIVERFICVDQWRKLISAVIVMTVSPEEAQKRDQGFLPSSVSGSIMNPQVLRKILETTNEMAKRFESKFEIFPIDTTPKGRTNGPKKTAESVADIFLNLIERHTQEDILHVPRSLVVQKFGGTPTIQAKAAEELVHEVCALGEFGPREQVEADAQLVQALPVVVVRNRSGDVLQMRRRERDPSNGLHEELVIWAGGHVRSEDADSGPSLLNCAVRELEEELRLIVNSDELQLRGAVYVNANGSTSRHLCIVYEWCAATDEVAVVLSSAEFFERRGTSLSGQFVGPSQLATAISKKKITEIWSIEIVSKLLSDISVETPQELF